MSVFTFGDENLLLKLHQKMQSGHAIILAHLLNLREFFSLGCFGSGKGFPKLQTLVIFWNGRGHQLWFTSGSGGWGAGNGRDFPTLPPVYAHTCTTCTTSYTTILCTAHTFYQRPTTCKCICICLKSCRSATVQHTFPKPISHPKITLSAREITIWTMKSYKRINFSQTQQIGPTHSPETNITPENWIFSDSTDWSVCSSTGDPSTFGPEAVSALQFHLCAVHLKLVVAVCSMQCNGWCTVHCILNCCFVYSVQSSLLSILVPSATCKAVQCAVCCSMHYTVVVHCAQCTKQFGVQLGHQTESSALWKSSALCPMCKAGHSSAHCTIFSAMQSRHQSESGHHTRASLTVTN